MRFVRLLGVTITIYGLSYLRHVATQMFLFLTNAPNPDVRYILLNLNIGMVTFVLGIGVLLAKEWARTTWLMCTIALLALHTVASNSFTRVKRCYADIELRIDSLAVSRLLVEVDPAGD